MKDQPRRKRPLLLPTNVRTRPPPPPPASLVRLESLLDKETKKKEAKRKVDIVNKTKLKSGSHSNNQQSSSDFTSKDVENENPPSRPANVSVDASRHRSPSWSAVPPIHNVNKIMTTKNNGSISHQGPMIRPNKNKNHYNCNNALSLSTAISMASSSSNTGLANAPTFRKRKAVPTTSSSTTSSSSMVRSVGKLSNVDTVHIAKWAKTSIVTGGNNSSNETNSRTEINESSGSEVTSTPPTISSTTTTTTTTALESQTPSTSERSRSGIIQSDVNATNYYDEKGEKMMSANPEIITKGHHADGISSSMISASSLFPSSANSSTSITTVTDVSLSAVGTNTLLPKIGLKVTTMYCNNKNNENKSKLNKRITERRQRQRCWTLPSLDTAEQTNHPAIIPLPGGWGAHDYDDVLPPPRSSTEILPVKDSSSITTTTMSVTHRVKDDVEALGGRVPDAPTLANDSSGIIGPDDMSQRLGAPCITTHRPFPVLNNRNSNYTTQPRSENQSTPSLQTNQSQQKMITNLTTTTTMNRKSSSTSSLVRNDNFVRLNLKNNAGACRGGRKNNKRSSRRGTGGRGLYHYRHNDDGNNKSNNNDGNYGVVISGGGGGETTTFGAKTTTADWKINHSGHDNDHDEADNDYGDGTLSRNRHGWGRGNRDRSNTDGGLDTGSGNGMYISKLNGLDPLDEFVDGNFHSTTITPPASSTKSSKGTGSTKSNQSSTTATTTTSSRSVDVSLDEVPKCARHQRPCKLVVVKKTNTGNKGRKFYTCCMPQGEQCNHFQWADDTLEAARAALARNSSPSSFIARQVAAHVDRFRTLTVPELRQEVTRRQLDKNGKRSQLLMRLAIWTRDEIVKSSPTLLDHDDDTPIDEEEYKQEEGDAVQRIRKDVDLSDCDSEEEDHDNDGDDDADDGSSSSSSSSSSEEELEFFNNLSNKNSRRTEGSFRGGPLSHANPSRYPTTGEVEGNRDDVLLKSLRPIFGHESFRPGQEWAIQRCLDEKKSLLIAPTGFGKSLCYALPAALMDGVCVVVSPLISLIQDQLRSLPPRIPAATLSGSISASATAAILDDVIRKRIKILFVSPERLTSSPFRRLFNPVWDPDTKTTERKFPSISVLCIDEAHCMSQWAHNFRPCFLRFKGLLQTMKPRSVLAITATAGPRVIEDIATTLGIETETAPFQEPCEDERQSNNSESIRIIRSGRDNIDVIGRFFANHEERLDALAKILSPVSSSNDFQKVKPPYAGTLCTGSVIVYVWRQKDTEAVAEYIMSCGVPGGVTVYHGGLDSSARSKSQSKFMRGKVRICVATVAFGLGIDKADVEGIIHLYLSNSPEHYLQEIGRAGRDGRPAKAIALPILEEVPLRHSLVYSDLVTRSQIQALLRMIRSLIQAALNVPSKTTTDSSGSGLHIALPVRNTVRGIDCKAETIETFLSLIELEGGDKPLLQVQGYNYDSATIALKKKSLKKLAEREPVAVSIQDVCQCIDTPLLDKANGEIEQRVVSAPNTFQRQFLAYSMGSYSFSITQCANRLGPSAEPRHVFAALRRLQSSNELEFALDTSERGRVFLLKVTDVGVERFSGDDYDKTEAHLTQKLSESFASSVESGASKVLDMHYILHKVAIESTSISSTRESTTSSPTISSSLAQFQQLTTHYFGHGLREERIAVASDILPSSFFDVRDKELQIDAISLLRDLPSVLTKDVSEDDSNFLILGAPTAADYSALAITKFIHGLGTPRTPASIFRTHPLFGKWKTVDFGLVLGSIQKSLLVPNK